MTKWKKAVIIAAACVLLGVAIAGVIIGVVNYNKNNMNFVIEDTLPVGNGKKAKVVLLAGQSNAAGCSISDYLKKNVSAEKFAEYETGYDNVYINYVSSDDNLSNGFVKTTTHQGHNTSFFGPEVGIAEKLHKEHPDELFFIIKFAWGATDLFSQWLSPSSDGATGYLYHNFIRYVKKNMEYLKSKGYDAEIEGLCWMQGESDSFSVQTATDYESNLNNFIGDVRSDLKKYAAADGIGFVDAYIAANPSYWVYYEFVNKSKQAVAEKSAYNTVIDTNAYGLVCNEEPEDTPDMAHYDSLSQMKLGNLFAEYLDRFLE